MIATDPQTTQPPQTMQQVFCATYGEPEVMQLRNAELAAPAADEVLIRVRASTVASANYSFATGNPFFSRFFYGLTRPRFANPGGSFAGEVVAIGDSVTRFSVGDKVFGDSPKTFGTHAEYKCLPEHALVAHCSEGISHADAAAITEATTALIFLRDVIAVKPGQHVLVNGASGSVGYFAVKLAKAFGAEVTAVCSTGSVALASSLGADQVIDYTADDFTVNTGRYDVIFDAAGKSSFTRSRNALTSTGIYATTVPTVGALVRMLLTSRRRGRKAKFAAAGLMQKSSDLVVLNELAGVGSIRAVIDSTYPLARTAEAYRYVGAGHKRGSVVVRS